MQNTVFSGLPVLIFQQYAMSLSNTSTEGQGVHVLSPPSSVKLVILLRNSSLQQQGHIGTVFQQCNLTNIFVIPFWREKTNKQTDMRQNLGKREP